MVKFLLFFIASHLFAFTPSKSSSGQPAPYMTGGGNASVRVRTEIDNTPAPEGVAKAFRQRFSSLTPQAQGVVDLLIQGKKAQKQAPLTVEDMRECIEAGEIVQAGQK